MEPNVAESVAGAVSEANAVLAAAHLTRVQPDIQADLPALTADSLALTVLSQSSGPLQTQVVPGAPDLACGMASDGAPPSGQLDSARTNGTIEKPPLSDKTSWRAHNELLPPARLVEVAHAALHSSGFRRRLPPGAQQPSHHDVQQSHVELVSTMPEIERSMSVKRELLGDSSCDFGKALDVKRPRTNSSGETLSHTATAEPPAMDGALDAVARVVNAGSLQPLLPVVKREVPPLPPLPNSVVSPFSRPQGRFSGSGTGEGTAAAPGETGSGSVHGPMKSAFSHAASLPTEWQPGCAVTTGRRSARSPAPKGSRNLSLMRATSAETNSGSVSRRGSGFGTATAALGIGDIAGAAVVGGVCSVAPGAISADHGVDNASAGANGASRTGVGATGGALESAASADLRRLAQLAEAAAMLEEQMVLIGGARPTSGGSSAVDASHTGAGGRGCAADDKATGATSSRACLDVTEHVMLRHRAASLTTGGLGTALGGFSSAELRQAASVPAQGCSALRSIGSLPGGPVDAHPLTGGANVSVRAIGGGNNGAREDSPCIGDDGVIAEDRRRSHMDSEAASDGGSLDGDQQEDDEDDDMGGEAGDGSNDSVGGGTSGGGGRTLTERYRAALKASAKQRGRGQNVVKLDPDKPPRGSNRNGLCARIASITKERLQQVYHLNIEEAARELGIGMTKLKEHCRTLGIPRWPSRKLKSMDKLIESLNERAMTEPATKEVIADILAEIESFKRAIYENPCLEVEEDIKRLRQSNFKKEYQQRQVEQRMRGGLPADKPSGGSAASGSGRSSSVGGSQHLQSTGPSGPMSSGSLAATASAGSGAPLPQAVLSANLAANLAPALLAGQLAAGPAPATNPAQMVQALAAHAQVQVQQMPGQMPLLATGQLQEQLQFLMAQQPNALQQLMAHRALGAAMQPAPALLLPAMLPAQLSQQQLSKSIGALAAVGETAPDAE